MKLVLFDIDGTLIYHIDTSRQYGFPRFEYAIKKVYGVDVKFSATSSYNGWVDKQIVRSIVPETLFPEKKFNKRWPQISDALYEYAEKQISGGIKMYGAISDAVHLSTLLSKKKEYFLGLITGNVKKMANWKIHHALVPNIFLFGLFGDNADNRIDLAQSVFDVFEKQFHKKIVPQDIIVIGDTIHDVKCGKAIGAKTIAVATGVSTGIGGIHGGNQYVENLKQEHPDILVDSLMDKKVLDFFHVNRT